MLFLISIFRNTYFFLADGFRSLNTQVKADGSLIGELDLFHHRPYECLLLGYSYGKASFEIVAIVPNLKEESSDPQLEDMQSYLGFLFVHLGSIVQWSRHCFIGLWPSMDRPCQYSGLEDPSHQYKASF